MRWRVVAVVVVALALGLASQQAAFGWQQVARWLPDLLVGMAFVVAGAAVYARHRPAAVLLVLTGLAWFAGNVVAAAVFWHRGPLVHLLISYPGWRPRTTVQWVAVAAGYVAAVTGVWSDDRLTVILVVALLTLVAALYRGSLGSRRHRRRAALWAAAAFGAVVVAAVLARLAWTRGIVAVPALAAYELVLVGIAVGLAGDLRRAAAPAVTDLVVELGSEGSGTLRDTLSWVLGDPTLRVGYWSAELDAYVDVEGAPVALPVEGSPVSATLVARDGGLFAVLVHDRALLEDASLVEAVAAATRLTGSNAALDREVRAQVAELTASRRRLVLVADEQRRGLERRLHEGPQRRLLELRTTIAAAPGRPGAAVAPHLARAATQLDGTLEDLAELARGLHPRELADGLAVALAGAAGRSPVAVALDVTDDRFPPEVEVAAWYTCAEALANATKHAAATQVRIAVRTHDGALRIDVADNGRGGADPSGSGLRGLADRLEALGGGLTVSSRAGSGTTLVAAIPLANRAGGERSR